MQFSLDDEKPKPTFKRTTEQGLGNAQSPEDIERELQEKLAGLGINLSSGSSAPIGRATQAMPTLVDDKRTAVLDIAELRNALRQQISIAEIKREIEKIIRNIFDSPPAQSGETQELELRAAALMLPYCKEYIADFPKDVRPSEFAVDLNLQDIIDFHVGVADLAPFEVDETVEQYAMQVIQTLLSHPLIPQKAAKRIGVDLKTTALKDERGTAMYSSSDAEFLDVLFDEQKLMERGGEVGLLAILISAKKWNKIDSDVLFLSAVLYTLEAMAKKRGITSIMLRGDGEDHPIAYILSEYITHALDQPLENLIKFIEAFLIAARDAINAPTEQFIGVVQHNYIPYLKTIFQNKIHESFDRFIETFRREFQKSQQTTRSKIFFFKRVGDLCEVSFYSYEAIKMLESASGEVYAKENLDIGTKHFASRNNIPLDETADILSKKNTLSELLIFTLKRRCGDREPGTSPAYFISKLMNDLLFFLDNLRRVFDHSYARGRSTSSSDYENWEEVIAECSQGYSRLFFGRVLSDIERYHFENIYKKLIERHLSFFDLQAPTLFQASDFKLEKFSKTKSPEDGLKESFLKFFISLHQALMAFDVSALEADDKPAGRTENLLKPEAGGSLPSTRAATLTLEAVQARAFLAQSDMVLSEYTIEALSASITPDAKDKAILIQALRSSVDLAGKARIAEEIQAMLVFLQNLRQRLSLIIGLSDQEKEQWRNSIGASLKELGQIDPIAISSYGLILAGIDDWDVSRERILGEWKNPETTIMRMQQLFFILLLKRKRDELRSLTDEYQRWLSLTIMPADSARKRVFDKRLTLIQAFARRGGLKLSSLRTLLMLVQYMQNSYNITIWETPDAYLLEDLLAVETTIKRIRDIEIVLSIKEPEKVRTLVNQFSKVFIDRCQQSASGYSYYTDEERLLMEKRLKRFETLASSSDWSFKRERMIFSLSRLLTKPFRNMSRTEKKNEGRK